MASSIFGNRFKKPINIESNVIVAAAAFWVNFCLLGVLRSNSVIYAALVDVFGVNREYAAWPAGILGLFMSITGALSGFLSHHISIRNLAVFGATLASLSVSACCYITDINYIILVYGALHGIGIGMIVPLTHVVLNQNFSKYRALALGVAYSGSSAGSFIFPPISNVLLSMYGLGGTFLLLGGIMLNSLLGALLFKTPKKLRRSEICHNQELQNPAKWESPPEEKIETTNVIKKEKSSDIDLRSFRNSDVKNNSSELRKFFRHHRCMPSLSLTYEIIKSPAFLIVSVSYAVYFTSSHVFQMVVVDFAQDRGLTRDRSVYLVSAFSIGDFCGRLSFGWVSDIQCIRRNMLVRFYLLAMGTLFSLLPICSQSALLWMAIMLGVLNGAVIVNHSVLLNEYLGLQKLPLAMGFSTCLVGLTACIRPLIIGFFRDQRQSYNNLFIFLGVLQISITMVWFLDIVIPFLKKCRDFVNKLV